MFGYADKMDKFFMVIGVLGSIGDGLQAPLMLLVVSGAINDYASINSNISKSSVDMYALKLLFVALGVGLSAFVGWFIVLMIFFHIRSYVGFCWARTAERQTARMRVKYLKSVLIRDVGFFQTQVADSSRTYDVISGILSDAIAVRIAIGEKVPDCIASMSCFFFRLLFCFLLSWKLTLSATPLTIAFLAPILFLGKAMSDVGVEMTESYGVAGGIAEQAISLNCIFECSRAPNTLRDSNMHFKKLWCLE